MNNIHKINNIKLNSLQIISAITEYIIVSCLDLNDKNFNYLQNNFSYWLEIVQTLNTKLRELTKVDEFEISNLETLIPMPMLAKNIGDKSIYETVSNLAIIYDDSLF